LRLGDLRLRQCVILAPLLRIAEHDVLLDHFDPDSMPVRVILALRDDYVYALNRWKRHLPALGQNNFELRALRGPAAFDAVFKPGELRCKYRETICEQNKVDTGLPPIVNKETAERIIRFVARKDEDVPLEEIEAVPPILSLLCRELNERRFTEPGGTPEMPARQITFSEGETDIATIITTSGSTPQRTGAKLLVFEDGRMLGTVGGGCVEADVWAEARTALAGNEPRLCRFTLRDAPDVPPDEEGMICGGEMEVFIEVW